MKLTIDFETRSACDIKKHGAWVYSEHPTTDIICCAAKVGGRKPSIWLAPWALEIVMEAYRDDLLAKLPLLPVSTLISWLNDATEIEAHNSGFEMAMAQNVATPKYSWPVIPASKWRCSAAKAAYHALPRALGQVCDALGVSQQKDKEGYKLMMKMCKPRRPTKASKAGWHEEPADIIRLAQYCLQDVEAEYALSQALSSLPPQERKVWQLDQVINARGIQADIESAALMVSEINVYEEKLLEETARLTNQTVSSPKQIAATRQWLLGQGVATESLDKAAVSSLLAKSDLPAAARRVLEIRQQLGKSSTSKYQGILDRASKDGRIRGALMYHGAATGRWSGQGIQPQNLPRGVISDPELALEALHSGGFELIDLVWGDPMGAASTCIRSMLTAKPGHELVCADFSSIEARVNAWLAGEETVLQAFRDGLDLYKVAAAGIFNKSYEKIDKQQRQVGKCSVLALGYGGGIGAYAAMAKGYGVDLEALPAFVLPGVAEDILAQGKKTAGTFAKRHQGVMSSEAALACDVIKQLWRRANPRIVQLWAGLEEAALMAVAKPGGVYSYGKIKYAMADDFLKCRLPSGRFLHYYKPSIESKMTDWGQEKAFIAFWSMNSVTKQWEKSMRQGLYGGLLCENCLASDTRVLTANGIKLITEVTPDDLVWDGVEWVGTDGCAYKGEQEVGEWLGIRSTRDHLILAGRSWITAIAGTEPVMQDALSLARDSVASLCWNQRTQTTESLCADATAGMNIESKTAACTGEPPVVAESADTISRGSPTPRSGATPQLYPTRQPGSCGCTGIPGSSPAVTTRTTKPTQTMAAGGSESVTNGAMTEKPSSAMPSPCLGGVTRPLSWTELTTREGMNPGMYGSCPAPSMPETDGQTALLNTTESGCPFQSSSRGLHHCGLGLQRCSGTSAKESPLSGLWTTTGRQEAVYDLLNCGPRSRFTIITNSGPVIVHNCVQALSRDLMAEAMLRVEEAGYPVVLSVHDELVSEIPEGFGSLEEYEKLMAMTPAWVAGCPINAEGWRGLRYKK